MGERTVRASNSTNSRTSNVVRVSISTKNHLPRILINPIMLIDESQDGERKKGWNICIIHKDTSTISINFERKYLAVFIMLHDSMLPNSTFEVLTLLLELPSKVSLPSSSAENLGRFLELNGHLGIGRNEISEYGCIVAGTECATDETRSTVERLAVTL